MYAPGGPCELISPARLRRARTSSTSSTGRKARSTASGCTRTGASSSRLAELGQGWSLDSAASRPPARWRRGSYKVGQLRLTTSPSRSPPHLARPPPILVSPAPPHDLARHARRAAASRVYYLPTPLMKQSISVARPNLISLGTCFGRFSKSGKFKLAVTSLDFLATYAKFKVWIKPNGELPFLYGNHVVKAHLGRITEDTPEHQGVVVFSMSDVPLGFGVTARSTMDTRKLDPTSIIVFHQACVALFTLSLSQGRPSSCLCVASGRSCRAATASSPAASGPFRRMIGSRPRLTFSPPMSTASHTAMSESTCATRSVPVRRPAASRT
jgi:60S ribosome subunit biogenesis protein NIP7